jgi:hypothetical protein
MDLDRYAKALASELDSSLNDLFTDTAPSALRSTRPSVRAAHRQINAVRCRNSYSVYREHKIQTSLLGGKETAYERYEID